MNGLFVLSSTAVELSHTRRLVRPVWRTEGSRLSAAAFGQNTPATCDGRAEAETSLADVKQDNKVHNYQGCRNPYLYH